jgi:hypothetical protein
MTIPIRNANIRTESVLKGFSRYRTQRVIYWSDNNLLTFNTYVRTPYKVTGKEKIMVVKPTLAYRPDLVSYDVYGFPDAWWKILEANNMKDIWDFKAGVTIILPDSVL